MIEVIEKWIKEKGTDPYTQQKVTLKDVVPNRFLQQLIDSWNDFLVVDHHNNV